MHPVRLMTDDLHSGRRIHPCPPEIRACRVAEIMNSQVRYSSPTTGGLESRPYPLNRLVLIQEHAIRVYPSHYSP